MFMNDALYIMMQIRDPANAKHTRSACIMHIILLHGQTYVGSFGPLVLFLRFALVVPGLQRHVIAVGQDVNTDRENKIISHVIRQLIALNGV